MLPVTITHLQSKLSAEAPLAPAQETPRRATHGGSAWALASEEKVNYQPQDGAVEPRKRVADIAARLRKAPAGEPEDARLTGTTRSLLRRVSGLNVGPRRATLPATSANVA